MRTLLLTGCIVLVACTSAVAGPPIAGIYKSILDDMPAGRFSESRDGGTAEVGNTLHLKSWDPDAAALGTEWWLWCPTVVSTVLLVEDIQPDGSGEIIYHTTYDAGHMWLSETGPWANGESYSLSTGDFAATTTERYLAGGVLDEIQYTLNFTATFHRFPYENCLIGFVEATFEGNTDTEPFPAAGYPVLIGDACTEGPTTGGWGAAYEVTFVILGCAIPVRTETATWGAVKSRYAE